MIPNRIKEAKKKLEKQIQETSDHLSASAKEAKKSFDAKLEDTLKTASSKADNILVSMEKKLEEKSIVMFTNLHFLPIIFCPKASNIFHV